MKPFVSKAPVVECDTTLGWIMDGPAEMMLMGYGDVDKTVRDTCPVLIKVDMYGELGYSLFNFIKISRDKSKSDKINISRAEKIMSRVKHSTGMMLQAFDEAGWVKNREIYLSQHKSIKDIYMVMCDVYPPTNEEGNILEGTIKQVLESGAGKLAILDVSLEPDKFIMAASHIEDMDERGKEFDRILAYQEKQEKENPEEYNDIQSRIDKSIFSHLPAYKDL